MAISYNNLWKLMIDKGMKKGDIRKMTGMSSCTMAKMTNNEPVTLTVIEKICDKLDCNISDVVEYVRSDSTGKTNEGD
ncbi:MAG: helix-turn-helix transcriptional regulator [Bacteroidales bacterium]|nr:helix-turn-helix transcriptional regulator [Bacteroidales bacterium]